MRALIGYGTCALAACFIEFWWRPRRRVASGAPRLAVALGEFAFGMSFLFGGLLYAAGASPQRSLGGGALLGFGFTAVGVVVVATLTVGMVGYGRVFRPRRWEFVRAWNALGYMPDVAQRWLPANLREMRRHHITLTAFAKDWETNHPDQPARAYLEDHATQIANAISKPVPPTS